MPPPENIKLVHDHPLLPTEPRVDTCPQGEPITLDLAANQVVPGATESFSLVFQGHWTPRCPFRLAICTRDPEKVFRRVPERIRNERTGVERRGSRAVETDNRNRDGQPWICWFLSHQAQLYSLSCASLMSPCSLPIKSTSLVQIV